MIFCYFIFPQTDLEATPQTNFHAEWLKRRGLKYRRAFYTKKSILFLTPTDSRRRAPKTAKISHFRDGKFSLDFTFSISGLISKHPLPLILLHNPVKVS